MRYGFTGSKKPLTDEQKAIIDNVLLGMDDDDNEFTTGACEGVDTYVGLTAVKFHPTAYHRVIVPANRAHVDYWWKDIELWVKLSGIDLEVIYMPEGTTYRQRNHRIVDFTDELVVFAEYPEKHPKSKRSGTWMTKRIASSRQVEIRPPFVFSELCTSSESSGNVLSVTETTDA